MNQCLEPLIEDYRLVSIPRVASDRYSHHLAAPAETRASSIRAGESAYDVRRIFIVDRPSTVVPTDLCASHRTGCGLCDVIIEPFVHRK